MPDTENCGRIRRKIPKTWSVEVVVGEVGKKVGWNRGVARGACCVVSMWADLWVPVVVFLY